MHHFTVHELADAWELRAGLADASAWGRAAAVAACLRECAAELRSAAAPQPAQAVMAPEYAAAVRELAEQSDMSEAQVLRAAVRLYQAEQKGLVTVEHKEQIGPLAAPQPEAQPQWQLPAQRLVQWLHCMSYNDSYFGEPAGYLKQCVNELKHLLPPLSVPAAHEKQQAAKEQAACHHCGEAYADLCPMDRHKCRHGLQQQAGEAVAIVELKTCGGNAGLSTRIKEIEDPMRDRLTAGTKLFTHPQQPLTEEQIRLERKRIDPMAEDMDAWSFGQGVRFAERAHGITKDTK